ncbi:glycosyltransferase [Pasteurella bettyae]|uniref:Glycosyltransferase, group 1 family protein n=1 Tax=Pasteurella bettyae CCUG 2042 TaxID=1095749 RepID=I3D7Y2_9PAST|nr:glycosyltransferase [Pasteurella bettyae]EIJ67825.1 glycosyltransferase, group 1 family protein [Pasteurella bettyae CCUG 2042]SUB22166.1 Glycogen synthase [Pasteurella bettyae]
MKRVLVYGMTDNLGGMEAYIHNLYQYLDKTQIQFDFVCDFSQMTLSSFYLENGCRIHFIPPKSQGLLKSLWAMWKVIKQNNYDVVYFNIMNAGYSLNMLPAFLLKRKVIAHSHSADTDKKQLHYILRWLLNFVTDVKLACSKEAGVFMFGEKKLFTVINNGINLEQYRYSEEKYHTIRHKLNWGDKKVILYVARMNHQKNPFFALDIMKVLKHSLPNVILAYVGTGELKDEIQQYISDNALTNVSLLGLRHDINELMIAADLLILPSLFEGLPIVAVEAQAAGLPAFLSETISKEVRLVNSIQFLPISNSADWIKEIEKKLNKFGDKRISDIPALVNAGYDIKIVAKRIQQILIG